MKIAIIGGNLCGAATAYCLREVGEANRARRRAAGAVGSDEEMEITIFEARPVMGGNKFIAAHPPTAAGGVAVEVGTVVAIPLGTTPLLSALLHRSGVDQALSPASVSPRPLAAGSRRSIGTWDYRRDAFALRLGRSRLADEVAASRAACAVLRAVGVVVVAVAVRLATGPGRLPRVVRRHPVAAAVALLLTLLVSGGGVVPPRWCVRAANRVVTAVGTRLNGFLAYGTSLSGLTAAATETAARLEAVTTARADRRGVTVGHLLRRAGLVRVARGGGGGAWLAAHGVRADCMAELVAPVLGLADGGGSGIGSGGGGDGGGGGGAYGEGRREGGTSGDLSTTSILALGVRLGELPLPAAAAARARLVNCPSAGGLGTGLVGGLASAAGAAVELGARVVAVDAAEGFGTYTLVLEGGGVRGPFGGVVLAAGVHPAELSCPQLAGGGEGSLAAALGYPDWKPADSATAMGGAHSSGDGGGGIRGGGGADDGGGDDGGGPDKGGGAWVGLVTGRLRPRVFNLDDEEDVPDCVCVFGGGPLLRVERVAVAGVAPDSPSCPAVIVERRWVHAAAVNRVGGGVEVDVLAAANAASLFGDDVPWK
ncbi:hypothetical protein MMPV_004194 [Pyropia vietnamensis]